VAATCPIASRVRVDPGLHPLRREHEFSERTIRVQQRFRQTEHQFIDRSQKHPLRPRENLAGRQAHDLLAAGRGPRFSLEPYEHAAFPLSGLQGFKWASDDSPARMRITDSSSLF